MTRTLNKIKNSKTKREAFDIGYNNGFGRGLGSCITFLRKLLKTGEEPVVTQETIDCMRKEAIKEREGKFERQFK